MELSTQAPYSDTSLPQQSQDYLTSRTRCGGGARAAEGDPILPGYPPPPDDSGSPPQFSIVPLVKRTICLPGNQTQISFPSNVLRSPGT